MCYFRKHATAAPAESGGTIHNILQDRASTRIPLQAQTLHVYGSGTLDVCTRLLLPAGILVVVLGVVLNARAVAYEQRTCMVRSRPNRQG